MYSYDSLMKNDQEISFFCNGSFMKHSVIDYKKISAHPDIISKIINIDAASSGCYSEIENLLKSDQSAASLVLRVANSPIYNRGKYIKTLPVAISILGVNVIRALSLLALSRSVFKKSRDQVIQLHIWQHSLLTALASQAICHKLGRNEEAEEAFIAGLLHDIGKVVLFTNFRNDYLKVLDYILKRNYLSHEAEQEILGIDHYQVGKQAIKEWKLPDYFANYTGVNLDQIYTTDIVLRSLSAANFVIKSAGIGRNAMEFDTRKCKLIEFGFSEELQEYLLDEKFLQELKDSELYVQCTQ